MPTPEQIDRAILSSTSLSWSKVAMVIGRVSKVTDLAWADDEDEFEVIAGRIEALVQAGSLVAQGDVKKWRHSEVRWA